MGISYAADELSELLGSCGTNVSIHRSVEMFFPKRIHVGSNVRIDCFCLLSAGLEGIYLGDHVHVAAGFYLFGGGGVIRMESFSGISARVSIYTSNDDYTEGYLTGPTVPMKYRKVREGPVTLSRHAIVGAGSVLMPGVRLGLASSVGALSFVSRDVPDFAIVVGKPARLIGHRPQRILEREAELMAES